MVFTTQINSPIGIITITASNLGIKALQIKFDNKQAGNNNKLKIIQTTHKHLPNSLQEEICLQAEQELMEYFLGLRKKFSIKLDPEGTKFQKTVWTALCKIPYGQTISYKTIAENIKTPKAYRAVGNANSKNPIPIIIPCHRVISSDGSLGGYSLGLHIKKFLLNFEQKNTK